MNGDSKEALLIIEELRKRFAENRLEMWEPYPKQKDFLFTDAQIGVFFAGNGVGKSDTAAGAVAIHATGRYPKWWKGKRFSGPIKAWCVGVTNETTRENCQTKLVGQDPNSPGEDGKGWLTKDDIISYTFRAGVPGAIDTMKIRHISGGVSYISFKSNEQGPAKLMGPRLNLIWADEEVDKLVFDELLFRFTGVPETQMLVTFTPLKGMTELVLWLLDEMDSTIVSKTFMSWDDARHADGRTHITEDFKKKIMKLYGNNPAILRSRMTGVASVGEGLVYQIDPEDITVPPFPMEPHWPRLIGLDFGWDHYTAAIAAAWDQDADTIYLYDMHYARETNWLVHAAAIQKWGKIRVAFDPAGLKGDPGSGAKLAHNYKDILQPNWRELADVDQLMFPANNIRDIAMGVTMTSDRMKQGKLLILDKPCMEPLRRELKLYRWDPKNPGKPIAKHNDALDVVRYITMSIEKARRIGQVSDMAIDFKVKTYKPATGGY